MIIVTFASDWLEAAFVVKAKLARFSLKIIRKNFSKNLLLFLVDLASDELAADKMFVELNEAKVIFMEFYFYIYNVNSNIAC